MPELDKASVHQLPYYSYRVVVTQGDRVHVEKRDAHGRLLGEPSGLLNFTGEIRARVQAWQKKAFAGQLSADEQRALSVALGEVLFDVQLREDCYAFYEQVRDKDEYVRLELDIDERALPELAALPWEGLCLAASERHPQLYAGVVPGIALVRHRALWERAPSMALAPGEPLRVALAVAAPQDAGPVLYQSIEESVRTIAREYAERFVLLDVVTDATSKRVDSLLKQRPHVLHIIAHARFHDEDGNEGGQLGLVDEILPGVINWLDAERLSQLFYRHRPGLVFLQACESGTLSAAQAFTGIASHIVQHNVAAVLAMQYELSNIAGQRFARSFYQALVDKEAVEQAAQEGRYELAQVAGGYGRRDFMTPVLFVRAADSRFFLPELKQEPVSDTTGDHATQPGQPPAMNVQASNQGIAVGNMYGGKITQNNNR